MPEDWHYVEVRHEGFKCRVRFCSNWSRRVSIHVRSQNTTTARLINPVVHAYAKLFSNEFSVLFVLFRGYGLRNRFIDPLSAYRCSMWRIGWHLIWIDDWNWDWDSVNWKTQVNTSLAWILKLALYRLDFEIFFFFIFANFIVAQVEC